MECTENKVIFSVEKSPAIWYANLYMIITMSTIKVDAYE